MASVNEKLCLTLQEASKYVGINVKKMSKLTKIKGFPCVFVGRRTLIIKSQLEGWFIKNYGKYF
ncbi:MAG: helix-turn-helix domain-containing protein [Clostridia bacterium]|nr:helix-turn-helix domain-containing protein [Clostridia bacterium]